MPNPDDLSANTQTGREHLRHMDSRVDEIAQIETTFRAMQNEIEALRHKYSLAFDAITSKCDDIDMYEIDSAMSDDIYPQLQSVMDELNHELDEEYGEEE